MDFGLWGEDMFLDQCLQKLNVGPVPLDERLMCEDHCDCPAWYWCNNGTDRVSYHPFKTVESYAVCMANAMQGKVLPHGKFPAIEVPKLHKKANDDDHKESNDDDKSKDDDSEKASSSH